MLITEREKEAHHEKPAIAVVEDVDEDVNLGNVILERFGENDERGVPPSHDVGQSMIQLCCSRHLRLDS